jgi:hypothetical protein
MEPKLSIAGGPQIQIYEVHPKTRLRVTTRRPLTTELLAAEPTTGSLGQESSTHEGSDYFTYQEDYVYEPTTEAGENGRVTTGPFADITPRLYEPAPRAITLGGKAYQTTTEIDSLSTAQPTTISQIVSTTDPSGPSTQQGEVHETADKHSTTTQVPEEEAVTEVSEDNEIDDGSVVKANAVSEEELELLTLDIASSLSNEIVDQVYEESQVVETTFNGKAETEEHTVANGRLTSYEKNIDTSHYGVDKDYSKEDLEAVVNEHGQQQLSSTEKDTHNANWRAVSAKPYHEIKRNEEDRPTVSIEEVEITESKDYSEPDIIYDLSRDSFESVGNPDSFSVPVSVAFNVPEKPTTTLQATESTTELTNPTTTYIAEEPTTMAATTERHYRHYNPTTYSRIYSLINRNKRPFTTTDSPAREVQLGTTGRSSLDLTGAQTVGPTTAEAPAEPTEKTYETAHKVPGRLWSAYEISRHSGETTTEEIEIEPVPERSAELDEEISVDGEHDEINTEGFNLASIMSYSMPDENSNATALPGIIKIDDLPKANEHESQVLVIEQVPESATNDPVLHKLPKAIDFSPIPLRQKDRKKKFATKTKKREEWIKNWVDRKYNKPKFPRTPLLPLAPAHTQVSARVKDDELWT